MKRRLSIALVITIAVCVLCSFNASAYTYYDISSVLNGKNPSYSSDPSNSGGVYLCADTGDSSIFWRISSSGAQSISFNRDGLNRVAFSGCGSRVAAVLTGTQVSQNGSSISQLQIFTHDFTTRNSSINTINSTILDEYGFALGKNCYYILQNDLKTIKVYSLKGTYQYSVTTYHPVYRLIFDNSGNNLFIMYDGGVYMLKGNTLYDFGKIKTPISLIGKSALSSADGAVYTVSGNSMSYICSVPSSKAAYLSGRVYYPSGSIIYSVDKSGEPFSSLDTGAGINYITVAGGRIIAVNDEKLISINPTEFSNLEKETQPASTTSRPSNSPSKSESDSISSQNSNSTNSGYNGKGGVSSSVYFVDNASMTINGIKSPTTIAKFKQNINYSGYKASFVSYSGSAKTSGNVGTGFIATFSGADLKSYTLIVPGDITGEGNINSRDVRLYMKVLCSAQQLQEPYLQASDINGDGICDTLDLVIAARQ